MKGSAMKAMWALLVVCWAVIGSCGSADVASIDATDDIYQGYDGCGCVDNRGVDTPARRCNEWEPEWDLLMIIDRPSDDGECHPHAPGADIDAVEVYRNGTLLAYASSVREVKDVQPGTPGTHPCEGIPNLNDDSGALLGLEDHAAGQSIGDRVYSLAGRTIFLELSEWVSNSDTIVVYEVDEDDDEAEDCFNIYVGYDTCEGDMAFTDPAFSGWGPPPPFPACGTAEGTISGLW